MIRTSPSDRVSHHHNSDQLRDILNPIRGIRDMQRRQGLQPTDYARLNRQAIRELSTRSKQVKVEQQESQLQEAARQAASPSVLSIAPRRPSSAHGRDFVVENIIDSRARAAAASAARLQRDLRQQEEEERWRSKPTYGKVPRYLQDVKVQLARRHADEQAAKEAALIPPGMRILPDEERLEMLRVLQQSRTETEGKLSELPFVVETATMIKHKAALEARMKEIEDGMRLFSRSKVLVQTEV
eukprot:jgi/Astpho2/8860/e_gw1.00129.68.1_t